MATVKVGSSIELTVHFYAYQGGPLSDPDVGPTLDILCNNESVLDSPLTYPGDIVKKADGIFSYVFTVPSESLTGSYTAVWTATVDAGGEESSGVEEFTVVRSSIVTADGSTVLGSDVVINYMTVVEPAFVDPDEILTIFPQADSAAVLESIHGISLEIQSMFPNSTVDNLPPLVHRYMVAAVACDLSRKYGYESSEAKSIMLGDLSVSYENSESDESGSSNQDWCSLASELRKEIKIAGVSSMVGVVRGDRIPNPIPSRSLRGARSNHSSRKGI